MPSTRARRHRRQLTRVADQIESVSPENLGERRRSLAIIHLIGWCREAQRRAPDLDAPKTWDVVKDPHVQAMIQLLDPNSELEPEAELRRACADALGDAAGRHLVSGSRPLADRSRRGF
jgi:hypothetical protein